MFIGPYGLRGNLDDFWMIDLDDFLENCFDEFFEDLCKVDLDKFEMFYNSKLFNHWTYNFVPFMYFSFSFWI